MIDRRVTFNEVAELYDRVRNHYPEQLFEELFGTVDLSSEARILEIGPGTGIATLQFAKRGYKVVGVELGTEMAAVARRKLMAYPNVEIEVAAFEEWEPPAEPFDLVIAATSFHWLDPAVRYKKAAAVLRGGAYLAIINYRAAGGDQRFFDEVQDCYGKHMPSATRRQMPVAAETNPYVDELHNCGWFAHPLTRRYITEETYNSEQYIELLSTYSDHLSLEPANQQRLFDCIATLIDHHYGGQVIKRYLNELTLARRL